MKKIIVIILIIMNLFPCLEINAKDTQFINEIYSESTIDTRKDLMEWRYKIINNRLYKRLFNVFKNRWETDWILVQ